ncbi:hypothetical protein DW322_13115 [Rhodococcus rhodnii]|uniref:Uncharacterized protein n=2 Tax=Rhodococcus rhodnii TaxID=38312 RepID=R7WLH9_9NOCA|nr:hypothetical protein [Rhodococcus rhodnii]EOM74834.1 hypothetical protein Rrhod_3824 [Rhodococcus rhodnii LMG 5362]TXG90991.1 hypothetical protein DW322_13115 [Rhodococcus rhodnii]
MTSSPLAPEAHVFDVPGRGRAIRATDGTFLRVRPGADESAARAGVAVRAHRDLQHRWTTRCTPARVVGDHPLLDTLRDVLPDAGIDVVAAGAGAVTIGAWLPGAARPDDTVVSPALEIAIEGALVFVGPLRLDATDATPSQVRRRRHAAAIDGPELAHWHRTVDDPRHDFGRAAHALVAARVLDVLRAWQTDPGAADRLRDVVWRFDDHALTTSEHVVLGFDEPHP